MLANRRATLLWFCLCDLGPSNAASRLSSRRRIAGGKRLLQFPGKLSVLFLLGLSSLNFILGFSVLRCFGHHLLRSISKAARAIKRDALTNDRRVEPFRMSIVPLSIRPGRSSRCSCRTFFRRKQVHSEATPRSAILMCTRAEPCLPAIRLDPFPFPPLAARKSADILDRGGR
jgi:hypothetical protein